MAGASRMRGAGSGLRLSERWSDLWHGWRDRLLANQRFQLMAARFPLTRGVANRRARDCFDLCAGFVYSQVLSACMRLDLFEMLAARPLGVDEIAARAKLQPERALILLRAAAALELVEERGGRRYGLGAIGAAMRANPGVKAMVAHHAMFYADMADPLALLRGEIGGEAGDTQLARYWPYAAHDGAGGLNGEATGAYTDLMSVSQQFVAEDILNAYDVTRHRRLMDIGGGDGAFLRAAARRGAQPALTLFDLPAVAEVAQRRFGQAGLTGRAHAVGGDFTRDALPAGHDLITLVRVAHDHDDAFVTPLFSAIHQALEPGGVLLIGEPMAGDRQAAAFSDAYFGFYFLAMGSGRTRKPDELCAMLRQSGFAEARAVPTPRPLMTALVMARKAG
jgi:demethylspheroidene O-methyltransferase